MQHAFTMEFHSNQAHDCVDFQGIIDAHAEAELNNLVSHVSRPVVRIDFSKCCRVNSMGLSLLLRCFKRIKEEKRAEIELDGLNQMNTMLFKISGVFRLAHPVHDVVNV